MRGLSRRTSRARAGRDNTGIGNNRGAIVTGNVSIAGDGRGLNAIPQAYHEVLMSIRSSSIALGRATSDLKVAGADGRTVGGELTSPFGQRGGQDLQTDISKHKAKLDDFRSKLINAGRQSNENGILDTGELISLEELETTKWWITGLVNDIHIAMNGIPLEPKRARSASRATTSRSGSPRRTPRGTTW